eukprot:1122949-Rhodomonas_salina.1
MVDHSGSLKACPARHIRRDDESEEKHGEIHDNKQTTVLGLHIALIRGSHCTDNVACCVWFQVGYAFEAPAGRNHALNHVNDWRVPWPELPNLSNTRRWSDLRPWR